MRNRTGTLVLTFILICSMMLPATAFAAESTETKTIEPDIVYMQGWHDIWRYSDGKTWQKTGTPNSWQELDFTWSFKPKGEIESITAVYFPEKTDSENKGYLRTSNEILYHIAEDKMILQKSSGIELYNNGKLTVPIKYCLSCTKNDKNPTGIGFDIKEYDWQAEKTLGYKYYFTIKVKIIYTGEELPPEEDPGAGDGDTTEGAIEETPLPASGITPISGCAKTVPFHVEGKSHTVYCSGCVCGLSGCYCPGHTCRHSADYTATLGVTGSLNAVHPNGNSTTFKSGYGFTVTANSTVTVAKAKEYSTNPKGACHGTQLYNNTNHGATITAPGQGEVRTAAAGNTKGWTVKNEDIKKLYNKQNYTQPKTIALEKTGQNSLSSSFKTAKNKTSNFYYQKGKAEQSRVIYTAIDLSGTRKTPKKHSVDVYLYGGGVVAGGVNYGTFCNTCNLGFTINGNMYEDSRVVTGSGKWTSN